jgi:hypothetical protein
MRLKLIAIMMILLIVSLPIYVSAAMTGIHPLVNVHGSDGVPSVVRKPDTLNIEARAYIANDPDLSGQLRLANKQGPEIPCGAPDIQGYNVCSLSIPNYEVPGLKDAVYLKLYNDDGEEISSRSVEFFVDNAAPEVQATVGRDGSTIKVSFSALDTANTQTTRCGGLHTIRFTISGAEVGKYDTEDFYEANMCNFADSFTFDPYALSLPDGEYELIATALDYVGNQEQYPFSLTLDTSGPQFSNLKIIDADGGIVTHMNGRDPQDATIYVEVRGNVDLNTVKADLMALNPGKVAYGDMQFISCPYNSEYAYYNCSYDVTIAASASGTLNLILKGDDDLGNHNEVAFSKTLYVDSEGPAAVDIASGFTMPDDDKIYLKATNNTITAFFTESGTGLREDIVFMDLSDLNSGMRRLPATRCEQLQYWTCTWENVGFAGVSPGAKVVKIHPDTGDRVGNRLGQTFTKNAMLDIVDPDLTSVTLERITTMEDGFEAFFNSGDYMNVKAIIGETTFFSKVSADFSNIKAGADDVQVDTCYDLGNQSFECVWSNIGPIDKYENDGVITFHLADLAGNEVEVKSDTVGAQVLMLADPSQTHGTASLGEIECSPSKIDKEIVGLIEHRVYCRVPLIGVGTSVIAMGIGECAGENLDLVKEVELMNAEAGSSEPYLKITLLQQNIPEDTETLEFSCPMKVFTRVGTTVYPKAGTINVDVDFYHLSLGDYATSLEEEIAEAEEDIEDTWGWVGTLNEVFGYCEKICSIVSTINNVGNFFSLLGMRFGDAGMAAAATPGAQSEAEALEAAKKAKMTVGSGINQGLKSQWIGGAVNKFCKFISCRLYYGNPEVSGTIAAWQQGVLEFFNTIATAGGIWGGGEGGVQAYGTSGQGAGTREQQREEPLTGRWSSTVTGRLNPKDSIVISVLTLCLPGIVYNLNKLREIECQYVLCLKSTAGGVPIEECERMKEYLKCKFIWGEIFQFVPFALLFDNLTGLIRQILYHNWALILDIAAGAACNVKIGTRYAQAAAYICLVHEVIAIITEVWADIADAGTWDEYWDVGAGYCSSLEEDDDD